MARFGGRSGGGRSSSGRGGGRSGRGGGSGGGGGDIAGFGIFSLGLAAAVLFFAYLMEWRGGALTASITRSTIQRTALPGDSVRETGYLRSDAGPLAGEEALVEGLSYFYRKTGVQPYLWTAQNLGGSKDPSWEQAEAAMKQFYKAAFADEGHLLVLFYEPRPEDYIIWYFAGSAAEAVIDEEAAEILLDYLVKYYYYGNLNSGEYFAEAFTKAADRIMTVTMDPKLVWSLIACGLALAIILAVRFVLARKRGYAKLRQERELKNTLAAKKHAGPEHEETKVWRGYVLKRIGSEIRFSFIFCLVVIVGSVFSIVMGTSLRSVLIGGLAMLSVPVFVVRVVFSHAAPEKGSDDSLSVLLTEALVLRWFKWKNIKPLLLTILPVMLLVAFIGITLFLFYKDGVNHVTRRLGVPPLAEQVE